MFGKAKNGVSKAAEGLGYVNERGLKGTAEDLTEKAKDTLEEKLDGTRAKELAEAVKNPSEALEKQKEKASEVKEGLKDAYGEGQVNAAVKANTTTEKENQEVQRFLQPKITKMSWILTKIQKKDKMVNYQKQIQNNIVINLTLILKMKSAFQIYQNEIKKYKRMMIPSICQMIMESKLELKNQRKLVYLRHKIY